VHNVLAAVQTKTTHPAFAAAYAVEPIYFLEDEGAEGTWSLPDLDLYPTMEVRADSSG
jgi:hypothetical protein